MYLNLNKIFLILSVSILFCSTSIAQDEVSINFKNLEIRDFIKITSKLLNKNILLSSTIEGKVDFYPSKKIYTQDLMNILLFVLESKGYTIIENKNILRIIKLGNDSQKEIKINKSTKTIKPSIQIISLKNAESSNVIKIINGIITQKTSKNKKSKIFATIDKESNSIVLTGEENELEYFRNIINKLDIDRQQVYVQARIIEISENITHDVGIKYGLNAFSSGDSSLLSFSSSVNGGSAIDISSLSTFGFNLSSMREALSLGMSLNLLNQNGAADIVSEPSLLCINNQESSIYVGQTISIKTGTTTTSSGIPTDTYVREDVGLTLKVKPRIANGNKVLLEINTKLEDVEQSILTNSNPNTSKKELLTSAIVNNGESIILGGYIRAKKENIEHKVPLLSDIPILGSLFRNNREVSDKINLVVIITPYIVPKSKNLSYIRKQLSQLKLLEDKYTKETILRLEKKKLTNNNDLVDNKQLSRNERLHQKRVKEVLGL